MEGIHYAFYIKASHQGFCGNLLGLSFSKYFCKIKKSELCLRKQLRQTHKKIIEDKNFLFNYSQYSLNIESMQMVSTLEGRYNPY